MLYQLGLVLELGLELVLELVLELGLGLKLELPSIELEHLPFSSWTGLMRALPHFHILQVLVGQFA